jgi:hypothetical protein
MPQGEMGIVQTLRECPVNQEDEGEPHEINKDESSKPE